METDLAKHGLVIFQYFPQIMDLGQETIQTQADAWANTPEAASYDVGGVTIGDASTIFAARFRYMGRVAYPTGRKFQEMIASLINYIIDHAVTVDAQASARMHAERLVPPPPPETFPSGGTPSSPPGDGSPRMTHRSRFGPRWQPLAASHPELARD